MNARRHLGVAAAIFFLAGGIRLWRVGAFTTFDEPQWAWHGVHFLHGLVTGNFEETIQFGAPGVFTMWSAALAAWVQTFLLGQGIDAWRVVTSRPNLVLNNEQMLRAAAFFLPGARVAIALLNALRFPVIYLLLVRLGLRPATAFLAATLAAVDPYLVGNDRVLHTDGPTAVFFFPALLAFLIALERREPSPRWLAISGAFTAAAALAKSTGALVAGPVVLLFLWHAVRHRLPLRKTLEGVGIFALAAVSAAFVLWPALWGAPLEATRRVLSLSLEFAETPHPTTYFLGQPYVETAPGFLFYPLSLALRTTPVLWFGTLIALSLLGRRDREGRLARVLILACALFLLAVGFSAKKFERYLVPLFPVLATLAALGWTRLALALPRARMAWTLPLAIGLLLACQAGSALGDFPYYLRYANSLLGGRTTAVRWFWGGWGEGLDQAAAFLAGRPDAAVIASNAEPALAPQVSGMVVPATEEALAVADYVIIYITDVQMQSPVVAAARRHGQLVFAARHRGVVLAEVYALDVPADHEAFLAREVPANSVVVGTMPFLALRRDPTRQQVILDPTQDGAAALQALNTLAGQGISRLWVMTSPLGDTEATDVLIRALETTAWRYSGPHALSFRVEARGYMLPPKVHFRPTDIDTPVSVPFGGVLVLEAAGLSSRTVSYPQAIEVLLRWRSQGPIPQNLTAFVHLLDANDHLWSQQDVPIRDVQGRGTAAWEPGTTAVTRHVLPLPAGIPPDTYTLVAGVYDEQLTRLSAPTPSGTTVTLASVQVQAGPVIPSPEAIVPPGPDRTALYPGLVLWRVQTAAEAMRPGQRFTVEAVWWANQALSRNLVAVFVLRDDKGQEHQRWAEPLAPFPTSRWRAGETLRVLYDLRLAPQVPTGTYTLSVGVAEDETATPQQTATVAQLYVRSRPHTYSVPATATLVTDAMFGQQVLLRAFTWPERVEAGSSPTLSLYWQARITPDREYKVFVHVVDDAGRIVAQADHVPQNGEAPTTGWLPGEVIEDPVAVPLPPDLPPGRYTILVGLYDARGERLSLPDGGTAYPVVRFNIGP